MQKYTPIALCIVTVVAICCDTQTLQLWLNLHCVCMHFIARKIKWVKLAKNVNILCYLYALSAQFCIPLVYVDMHWGIYCVYVNWACTYCGVCYLFLWCLIFCPPCFHF